LDYPRSFKTDLPVEIAPQIHYAFEVNLIQFSRTKSWFYRMSRRILDWIDSPKLFQDVFHSNCSVIVPLVLADQSLGFVMGNLIKLLIFRGEIQRLSALAGQVAIIVQGLQLLKQTKQGLNVSNCFWRSH
jgi:hypothetical protein